MLGVCGAALNQVFFLFGLARTSTAHAAIMIGLTPILVLLAATALGQEPAEPDQAEHVVSSARAG